MEFTSSQVDATIAERLKGLRGLRALTLDELAGRSGVSRAMISRIERGEASPTAQLLSRLCAALDVTLSAPGQVVTGDVKVLGAPGGPIVKTLSDGTVRFRLPVFKSYGKVTLKVNYLGSADDEKVSKEITFRVRKSG